MNTTTCTHILCLHLSRLPLIVDPHRERIEKYITGIVKNNDSHLYAIYANPEHVHFLISRSQNISEKSIAKEIDVTDVFLGASNGYIVGLEFVAEQGATGKDPKGFENPSGLAMTFALIDL